jgi:hypothetical protein
MKTPMKKTKKLIKQALKRPELYTPEELHYMQMVQRAKKLAKQGQTPAHTE